MNEKIGIIGAGRLGQSLARALCEAGCSVQAIYDADETRAKCCVALCGDTTQSLPLEAFPTDLTLLFIAVPDDSVTELVEKLSHTSFISLDTIVAHTSGVLLSAVLAPLRPQTELLAAVHPVQTLTSSPDDWQRLFGIYYGVEGHYRALPRLRALVQKLRGKIFIIPQKQKALYHIGCVFASNYLISVEAVAIRIMEQVGFTESEAISILEPLVLASLDNIKKRGIARALSGPIVRGDIGTVARHIEELGKTVPALVPTYMTLGQISIDLAESHLPSQKEKLQGLRRFITQKQQELQI